MKNKTVVYTAIFGDYDELIDPTIKINADLVVFTDTDLKSNVWDVRKVNRPHLDITKCARKYKVLPHKWFPEYDFSVWVDGNFLIHRDISDLPRRVLPLNKNFATYDHMQCEDKRNCIYEEYKAIKKMWSKGNKKDDPVFITKQIHRYLNDNYPKNNGLISSGIIVRRHNEDDCIKTMEHWWREIDRWSKRDQLSFNYVAWKNNFNFNYIKGDVRKNEYATLRKHKK